MAGRIDLRVIVAGGGALGSAVALALARRGASVILADPGRIGEGASAVAAGMLAPVFESLFDPDAPPVEILRRSRATWSSWASSIDLSLDRSGAMAVGDRSELDAWEEPLAAIRPGACRLSPAAARARSPWLGEGLGALFTDEDWRLEPADALAAMRRELTAAGGRLTDHAVAGFEPGAARLSDGRVLKADALVVATGASAGLIELAPELAVLRPIKGHILRAPDVSGAGPVLRRADGYLCPSPGGALIGATMEFGRSDALVDPEAVEGLRRLGASIAPAVGSAALVTRTGIRAATPDGLPMVGASERPGVWLADGARRNGWLMAPLIAEVLAAAMAGEPPGDLDALFAPHRFAVTPPL